MMNDTDSIFQRAVSKLLVEVFDGPPTPEAFVLNPGDPGLLRQLGTISAATASLQPVPGKASIASHAHHILFGLNLLNRWLSGNEDPFANADFNESWRRTTVTDEEWRAMCDDLRKEADAWRRTVAERSKWDDMSAAAALSTIAHTAYHLGAIRQVFAAALQV
jgi:hypothetical protein